MKQRNSGGLVYSTDQGRMCPGCRQPSSACTCGNAQTAPVGDGIVRVQRETKGRKGKGVTLVSGVPLGPLELLQLGKELKTRCGSGGTVKDGVIEIQGDHAELLLPLLKARGWTVKRSGG